MQCCSTLWCGIQLVTASGRKVPPGLAFAGVIVPVKPAAQKTAKSPQFVKAASFLFVFFAFLICWLVLVAGGSVLPNQNIKSGYILMVWQQEFRDQTRSLEIRIFRIFSTQPSYSQTMKSDKQRRPVALSALLYV